MSTDSPGDFEPAGFFQSPLSTFEDAAEFELDCEDCVDFVTVRGNMQDAKTYGKRHVEARSECQDVGIVDPDTGRTLARVSGNDFVWLSDRPMPTGVAGSR